MAISAALLIRIFLQLRQSMQYLQTDLQTVFIETSRLLNSLNKFVQTDLSMISQETSQLINQLSDLSTDINNKSHSLNFLFKPLSNINDKVDSSLEESSSKQGAFPQIMKWIASSAVLFKATKELINRYGKQK
jgi:uncharacterized protein YoxC